MCDVECLDSNFNFIWLINSSPPSVIQISIGADNGLSPIRHQAIIWTNAGYYQLDP